MKIQFYDTFYNSDNIHVSNVAVYGLNKGGKREIYAWEPSCASRKNRWPLIAENIIFRNKGPQSRAGPLKYRGA